MGEGFEDKASVPTSVFAKPQPHRTPLEKAPEESHQHRILQSERRFRRAVTNFFEHIADYKEELKPLLTLNFRLVNSKIISL
jgi:hypothetical protein